MDLANSHEPTWLTANIPSKLGSVGVNVGPKTSRNRLLQLLDLYVKPKKPRLSVDASEPRVPSNREARAKRHRKTPKPRVQTPVQRAETQAPQDDIDFNLFDKSELINLVEGVGLNGKKLCKEDLVRICMQYRDLSKFSHLVQCHIQSLTVCFDECHLVVIPTHSSRFTISSNVLQDASIDSQGRSCHYGMFYAFY